MTTQAEISEQSAWNLSQHDIFLMGNLWRMATSKYLRGDTHGAYFETVEIRNLLHTDLKSEEDSFLNEIEKRIDKVYVLILRIQRKLDEWEEDEAPDILLKKMKRLKVLHGSYVMKYRRAIREMMGKYGYLVAKKEDRTKLRF
jgi:transcriptional regulator with XRE-family HTH domain